MRPPLFPRERTPLPTYDTHFSPVDNRQLPGNSVLVQILATGQFHTDCR